MPEFDFEDMRYILSPLQVLDEITMPTDGLMRARILAAEAEEPSVIGYDFMWNKGGLDLPIESDRIKVVEIALGEASLDLTVALILPEDTQDDITAARERMREMQAQISEQRRERDRQMEASVLEHKKSLVRMQIMQQAELTPDAVDLIKSEVTVEHPELYFPDGNDKK